MAVPKTTILEITKPELKVQLTTNVTKLKKKAVAMGIK